MYQPPCLSEEVKEYAEHVRDIYMQLHHADTKWPCGFNSPSEMNMFIDLAIVKNDPDYNDEFSRATVHGSIDDIVEKKKAPISLEDLCKIPCGSSVLIEGAPGIGKSTLAFELCRRWVSGIAFQKHNLLLLLQLRDKMVQSNLSSIKSLLGCYLDEQSWKQKAVEDIINKRGSGVLIILEGYDELPDNMDGTCVINNVLRRNVSKATIIVTTRPSSKHRLVKSMSIFKYHIEVLGFTKASIAQYVSKFFEDKDPFQHAHFQEYIKRFPLIEGCLYVPINLIIVLDVFQHSCRTSLPETMTELYDTLIRMLIYRHLKSLHPSMNINFSSLKELPQPTLSAFHSLCKLAYEGIRNRQQLVFYRKRDENMETLDLMQKISLVLPSKGGDVFVYSFLHLTIQEFLAAYHIHLMPLEEQQRHFDKYNSVPPLATMMRFFAGLTSLKLQSHHKLISETSRIKKPYIFHELFEARNDALTSELFSGRDDVEVSRLLPYPIPSDMYMIARCIALGNCQWRLSFTLRCIGSKHLEMFISGLNSTNNKMNGKIENVSFSLNPLGNEGLRLLCKFPKYILENLCNLYLRGIEVDRDCFDALTEIPNFVKLETLQFHHIISKKVNKSILLKFFVTLNLFNMFHSLHLVQMSV